MRANINNFRAMPALLKLLIAASVVPTGILVSNLISGASLDSHDAVRPNMVWSGTFGLLILGAPALLFLLAAFLMLLRLRVGRAVYSVALLMATLAIPVMGSRGGGQVANFSFALYTNLLLTAAITFYLFSARSVRHYFDFT